MDRSMNKAVSSYVSSNFRCYSCLDELQEMLDQNVSISIVHDLHRGYFAMMYNNHEVSLKESASASYRHDEL
eukprot:9066560-Ditylum_brightwellii.AAC.1